MKLQPLDYIRDYYGERIALYFAWLEFYTLMLVPVSLIGIIVFIYGTSLWNRDPISKDICDKSLKIVMCPLCDKLCDFWYLSTACKMAKMARVVDNGATVVYAIIMSLWATLFLEFWKRKEFQYRFRWHQAHVQEEEESPRPEYLNRLSNVRYERVNKVTGVKEKYFPFWRKRVPIFVFSGSFVVFMILLALLTVAGVIFYRIALRVTIAAFDNEVIAKNSLLIVACTAASINLCIIFALNFIYRSMAEKLTEMECFRTQSEHDASLNLKIYLLQVAPTIRQTIIINNITI
jgi:anoctamin-1